jgi:hypothetical protein
LARPVRANRNAKCTATNHIHIEQLATYFVATILMPPRLRC